MPPSSPSPAAASSSRRSRVYLDRLDNDYLSRIRDGLSYIGFGKKITRGDHVFIKPNLTFPHYVKGVMTSPQCLEAVIVAIKDYTDRITVGESDSGGYNPFSMDKVFEGMELPTLARKYGVQLVNMTTLPSREITFEHKRKTLSLPLPTLLLDDVALSVSVPVPKVHMHTKVTGSIKNQWGCIQDPAVRLRMHPYFARAIYEISKACRFGVAIFDGACGLNRCGPMVGDCVELGWIMVADSVLAADTTCCRLMRIAPESVPHLRFFQEQEAHWRESDIDFNVDYRSFVGPQFYLEIPVMDIPGHLMFRSPFLAWLGYRSPAADFLHKVKYLFTKRLY